MQTPARIFVSYSHADAAWVTPVVALLRTMRSAVFLDSDTIRPGKRWRDEVSDANRNPDIVLVFWCSHSTESVEVRDGYALALDLRKDLLPVLLDFSPLPPALAEVHTGAQAVNLPDLDTQQRLARNIQAALEERLPLVENRAP